MALNWDRDSIWISKFKPKKEGENNDENTDHHHSQTAHETKKILKIQQIGAKEKGQWKNRKRSYPWI